MPVAPRSRQPREARRRATQRLRPRRPSGADGNHHHWKKDELLVSCDCVALLKKCLE